MDISAHLIELLRLNDCVIIPDLGGFVTNYRPADIDLAGNSFNPPRKEVIFSAMLKKNDGLLVNHICESEGIGYMEARLLVTEFVEESQSRLENGEVIELPMIGLLKYDRNEKLIFEPEIKDNLLLDAYGLEPFQFPQLKHSNFLLPNRHFHDKEAVKPVFSKRKIKTLAITIPVLLALLMIPVKKNSFDQHSPLNFQTSNTAPIILNQPPAPEVNPAGTSKESNIELFAEKTVKSVGPNQTENIEVKSTSGLSSFVKKYHLIGGCFKVKENAEKLLVQLRSLGYDSTLDQAPSGNFMVTIQSYSDKEEAIAALKNIQGKDPKAGYWMSVK